MGCFSTKTIGGVYIYIFIYIYLVETENLNAFVCFLEEISGGVARIGQLFYNKICTAD